MKTLSYLLTALAITVQVTVSGQTQGNQSKSSNNKDVKKIYTPLNEFNPKTQTATKAQFKEFSFSSSNGEIEQIATPAPITGYNKSLQIKGNTKDVKELLEQTEEMLVIEKQLREKSKNTSGSEKQKLIEAANGLAKQIEYVQIQASEINGRINLETFEFNKEIYMLVLNGHNGNENVSVVSKQLTQEAEQSIKLAKELRQEAYAMPNNAAKLGTLINAEEKEGIAISKQTQAIEVLKKSTGINVMAVK